GEVFKQDAAISIIQMHCRAPRYMDGQRTFEALAGRSAKSGLVAIRQNPVVRSFALNLKRELPVQAIGLFTAGRSNCLLHINNDFIRLGGTYFDIPEKVHNFDCRVCCHALTLDTLIKAVVVTRNIPEVNVTDSKDIPDIGTDMGGGCYGA